MRRRRIEEPSEVVALEAKRLTDEYLAAFSDDDVIPDGGIANYLRAHASSALLEYLNMVDATRRDAKKREGRIESNFRHSGRSVSERPFAYSFLAAGP